MVPHASGTLWLPEHRTALIADLHLGYGWAQRRRGELGFVGDGDLKSRLIGALADLQPQLIVLLGDVVHAPSPSPEERQMIRETLAALDREVIIVRGNHDRAIERDLGVTVVDEWRIGELSAIHGHRVPSNAAYIAMGHHHPVVKIRDAAGVPQRVRAFVIGPKTAILPAFSPFAAGTLLEDLPADLRQDARIYAITGRRVVELGRVRSRKSATSPD